MKFLFSAAFFVCVCAAGVQAQTFVETDKLTASDGAADDWFGDAVAISGTTAVIGSSQDDDNGNLSGSAYLYDTSTGDLLHKLTPDDPGENDRFGFSVAIDGSVAIVGARDDNVASTANGSAYLFDTATGSQLLKLVAPDGATFDRFGRSVGISGNIAIVGAAGDDDSGSNSGSAYLFDTTSGNLLHKLVAPDGAAFDNFGYSVDVDGTNAIVGAYADDDNGSQSGSAYLFDTTTGNLLQKFTAPDGASSDLFGYSVAISGNIAIIGAYEDDDKGSSSGSAYLFEVSTGNLITKITASNGGPFDYFGYSVDISGTTAVVGAQLEDTNGSQSGSMYVFNAETGAEIAQLTAEDGAGGDELGRAVGISGSTIVTGAPFDDDNGSNSGSAYVFSSATAVPEVSASGALAAFGSLLALMAFLWERRRFA